MHTIREMAVTALIATVMVTAATGVQAGQSLQFNYIPPVSLPGQTGTIQWPSNSISLSQLQSLFSQNPTISQLHIQFPNNASWDVTPQGVESLISNYAQQASSLGLTSLPNLSFSSLNTSQLNANMLTVPINNLTSGMNQSIDNELRDLRFQEEAWLNTLPQWLREGLVTLWGYLLVAWEYLQAKAAEYFSK